MSKEINLYGGPKHGSRYVLHKGVMFISAKGGHYAQVSGGRETDFYWHEIEAPFAVNRRGILIPVEKFNPNKHGNEEK